MFEKGNQDTSRLGLCVLHGEKVPYEIENSVKGREFVCGFADLEYGSGV